MKKSICSIIALLITLIMVLGGIAPTVAFAIDNVSTQAVSTKKVTDVPISERYHIIENGYRGKYDLQEGIFGHQSSQQVNKTAVYFYSDGYFEDAPEIYNPNLSTMSMALSIAAFNARPTDFDRHLSTGKYSNLFRHAKVLMSDIGIEDKNIYINDSFDKKPTDESIGMIIGAKEILIENSNYILIPIAVRGGDYEAEWASNVNLGESGESQGFSTAATKAIEQIENYINTNATFNISSALQEGRVKFWVVGYSRGGAVANIVAKRLTDTYGKEENDIYAYSFEAPAGGVDAAEIKESWTYNGVYANIHNIINPCDLIPQIPPKQLGFKRYGVDHYNPGTEAGEIITSVYTTPTGITVTTRVDNVAYVVGDENYTERRTQMIEYLATIDSNIKFSDSFSLATIDLSGAIFNGSYAIKPLEGKNVTAAEWLQYLVEDLLNWAANGTYNYGKLNDGGYNNDYRDFYISNSYFADEEYATLENALQYVLKFAFSLPYDQYDETILNDFLYRLMSLTSDYYTILDLYMNVIQKWSKLSESKQGMYIDKIWNLLNSDLTYPDGTPVTKLIDFVEPEEHEAFKESFYTLSSFLLLFISKDHTTSPSINGVKETQVHMVTLLYNIQTLIQGHFPEICLAWLNTYDDNYSLADRKFANTEVKLVNDYNNSAPDIKATVDVKDNTTTVSLSSIINSNSGVDKNSVNNGSAIYYAVYENGNMVGDWTLYRSPIVLDISGDTQYTIKALAIRFEEIGAELEITNEQLRTPAKEPDVDIIEPPIESTPPHVDSSSKMPYGIIIGTALLLIIVVIAIILKKRKK